MRCKHCGSTMVRADVEHKQFSKGKAVAGAVTFGVIGAAAGFIGKDQKGYRCGACGAFMEAPMDFMTESLIDTAISEAESGKDTSSFNYYKKQYPNIQANIPQAAVAAPAARQAYVEVQPTPEQKESASKIKHSYRNNLWAPDCPVHVKTITIKTGEKGDTLSLEAYNQGDSTLRSAYFNVAVLDDTGDKLGEVQCVYQGLSVAKGEKLPEEQEFPLNTDLAYRVDLTCEKAALEDGGAWRMQEGQKTHILRVQEVMSETNFPRFKYVRENISTVAKLEKDATLYMPVENEESWQCICGHPAEKGKPCRFCSAEFDKLDEFISQKNLMEIQQNEVKARAAARAKKTLAAREAVVKKIYDRAVEEKEKDTQDDLRKAIAIFESISDYNDSAELSAACAKRIEELDLADKEREERKRAEEAEQKRIEEEEKKKTRKKALIITPIVLVVAAGLITALVFVSANNKKVSQYNNAVSLVEQGNFDEAIAAFTELGDFKDSPAQIENTKAEQIKFKTEQKYQSATTLFKNGDYDQAIKMFTELGEYKDSAEMAVTVKSEGDYQHALSRLKDRYYDEALTVFTELGDYKDSKEKAAEAERLRDESREYCVVIAEKMNDGISTVSQQEIEKLPPYSYGKILREIYKQYIPYCGVYKYGREPFTSEMVCKLNLDVQMQENQATPPTPAVYWRVIFDGTDDYPFEAKFWIPGIDKRVHEFFREDIIVEDMMVLENAAGNYFGAVKFEKGVIIYNTGFDEVDFKDGFEKTFEKIK